MQLDDNTYNSLRGVVIAGGLRKYYDNVIVFFVAVCLYCVVGSWAILVAGSLSRGPLRPLVVTKQQLRPEKDTRNAVS
jgi:hypothetical protein